VRGPCSSILAAVDSQRVKRLSPKRGGGPVRPAGDTHRGGQLACGCRETETSGSTVRLPTRGCRKRFSDKAFQRAAQDPRPAMAFAGFAQRRQKCSERGAVVFRYAGFERIGERCRILETVERVEHAEAFAGIGRNGEHAHLHARFQFLVGFGHVLGQGLLACGEEQQAPLLYLSACLASVIGASLPGAVAEHVDRFANDAWIAHADFIQYQESIRMRGSDGLQRVVS
jgi:hypothetical protein